MAELIWLNESSHREHPLWQVAQDTLDALQLSESGVPEGPDPDDVADVAALVGYVRGLQECPSPIVTKHYLDQFQVDVANLLSQIPGWLQAPAQNVDTIRASVENIAVRARSYPVTKDSYSYGVRASFEAVVATASDRLNGLQVKVDDQVARLSALDARAVQIGADATTELESLKQQIEEAGETISMQITRLDTALTNQQTAFADAEAKRQSLTTDAEAKRQSQASELFASTKTMHAELREQNKSEAEQERKSLEAAASEVLANLQNMEDHARDLVGAIGIDGTATSYGLYAKQERRTANFWRWTAAILFVLAFALFLGFIVLERIDGGTPWQAVAIKFGGSLALLAGGGYASRESSQHRARERSAKDTELLLNALEPFIANLESDQDKENLRKDVAAKVFAARLPNSKTAEEEASSL